MFQLMVIHNEDLGIDLGEYLESVNRHGLEVISRDLNEIYQETTLILQGSKEQFFSWNDEFMVGGPSWSEEEFLEELTPV